MLALYSRCLTKYSLATNCTTALFVYSVGDVAAQYLEKSKTSDMDSGDKKHIVIAQHAPPSPSSLTCYSPLAFVDWSRTREMLVWSAGIYTPLFVLLYQKMDVVWPTNSTRHICCKVATSSLANIPTLCLFFTFGVAYPRVKECVCVVDSSCSRDNNSGSSAGPESQPVLAVTRRSTSTSSTRTSIMEASVRRIEQDLVPTLTAGFAYWWPANAVIFRCVPSLLRPVGMSVCSVVWGCYLSMVQYKK